MIKIHVSPVKQMLKEHNERVSAAAINELINVLGELGEEISKNSAKICKNSGRKTVTAEDIKLTLKLMGFE